MRKLTPEQQAELVILVHRYFTPFAVLLVVMGLALSQPRPWVMWSCVGLLLFTGVFNMTTARWAQISPQNATWTGRVRLVTNLGANVFLVYILGGYWRPIWLLFVLTPAATALYSDRRRTLVVSGGVSLLLLLTQAARGFNAPLDWGSAVAQALFIVFLSLFLNELGDKVKKFEAGA